MNTTDRLICIKNITFLVKRIARQLLVLVSLIPLIIVNSECVGLGNYYGSPKNEIPADEILYKIRIGEPVEYNNIIVKGDLNLNQLALPEKHARTYPYSLSLQNVTVVSSPISIKYSEIDGETIIINTLFENSVNFMGTNFNGDTTFFLPIFNGSTTFSHSKFNGNVSFYGSHFNGPADFRSSIFSKDTTFEESTFRTLAEFSGTEFREDIDFIGSNFNEIASFGHSKPHFSPFFIGKRIMGDDTQTQNKFSGDVDFQETKFNGTAYFIGCRFIKTVNFGAARFKDGADFNGSEFKGSSNFKNSVISGFLNLSKATFNRLDIFWPRSTRLICDDGPTYLALIKNFRDLEKYDVADDVYYEYRQWRQDKKSWLDTSKYIDILGKQTCGYGVRVIRTIFFAINIFIIFGFIYSFILLRSFNKENYYKIINESFLLSLIILLSAPCELYPPGVDAYRTNTDKIKYWPILERLIGWALMLLLINTLSRVMIRY